MNRVLSALLPLSVCAGCTVVEHIQVLPTFDKQEQLGCCVLYAEVAPTRLSVAVNKNSSGTAVKLGASWKF